MSAAPDREALARAAAQAIESSGFARLVARASNTTVPGVSLDEERLRCAVGLAIGEPLNNQAHQLQIMLCDALRAAGCESLPAVDVEIVEVFRAESANTASRPPAQGGI